MPVSRKRKVETNKKEENQKHINVTKGKGGKLLILILCASMVLGILVAAVVLMIQYLG